MDEFQSLKAQLKALEDRVSFLEKSSQSVQSSEQDIQSNIYKNVAEEQDASYLDSTKAPEPYTPGFFDKLFDWLKTDWLMKLGAFLLLLGLAWFMAYSFRNNWISPMARITLGMLSGAAIMTFGHFTIPKRENPGKVLLTLGGIVMLISMFAARNVYGYFNPPFAFAFMFLVIVSMAFLAVLHNSRSIAITALIGGAFVPVLIDSGSSNEILLLSYILILNLGTLLIAKFKGWRSLITISLFFTAVYSLSFDGLRHSSQTYAIWIFMAAFYGLFLASSLLAILKDKDVRLIDLITNGLSGLLFLLWTSEYVPVELRSLVLVGVVILLLLVSQILFKHKKLKAVLTQSSVAVLFLIVATVFELDGSALLIALSVEGVLLVASCLFLIRKPHAASLSSLMSFMLVPMVIASLDQIGRQSIGTLLSADFIAVIISILTYGAIAFLLFRNQTEENEDLSIIAILHAVLAGGIAAILLWISTEQLLDSENLANGISLVIYTLIGLTSWIYGTQNKLESAKIVGNVLLGGVVLHLLIFEVWSMSLLGRIITFVAIGILLISTAFIEKNNQKNK